MTYSRPHMLCGLALMAAGAVLLAQQGCQPNEQPAAKQGESMPCCPSKDKPAGDRRQESPPTKTKKPHDESSAKEDKSPAKEKAKEEWKSLFDGKTLAGWKATPCGGAGEVYVKDGAIVMEPGSNMTGVTWTGDVLRNNYELALDGMKLQGTDFFCTTTFPVGDDYCTLVVGGWGGGLVGLSNVDRHDASENSTSKYFGFKKNRWYRVRIRVTDAAIDAWIDDEQTVHQPRKGHKFGIRSEVDLCRPLGICTWITKGAVRNVRVRPLNAHVRPINVKGTLKGSG
jgi:hypothetical protein